MKRMVFAVLALLMCATTTARAQILQSPVKGQWAWDFSYGSEFDTGFGDIHDDFTGTALGGTVNIEASTFDDAFDSYQRYQITAARGISNRWEFLLNANYSSADGESVGVGTFNTDTLNVEFDEYSELGVQVGFRRYFVTYGAIKPYFSFAGGGKFVSDLEADISTGFSGVNATGVAFYESGFVPTGSVALGTYLAVTNKLAIGVETGLQYSFELSGEDDDLNALGLTGLNGDGSRLSIPLLFSMRAVF